MALQSDLQSQGWNLSQEGIDLLCEGLTNPSAKDVIKKALNHDFKEIGSSIIPEDINRGKVESMPGNVVLMVTKIRNVAAPKVKEESGAAPRMLKVSMTDGVMTCHAVEVTECPRVSLKTPPGTKIKLKGGQLEVANGFIKVNDKNLEVLGGEVEALVEKWKVSSELAEFTNASRAGMIGSSGEGPPKWIPFGQKNKMPKSDPSNKDFKALASSKDDEDKDDGEFASQRQEAILEATKVEQKKFTASTKNIKESKAKRDEERRQANRENREKSDSVEKTFEKIEREREEFDRGGRGRGGRGRGRGRGRRGDREEEPEGGQAAPSKPSLFDFLQGQIPNAPPPAAKEETKTYERERPKTDLFNKGERKDNRDARNGGGRRDNDVKGKTSNHQSSKKDEDRRKDGFSEKRDSNTDKRKDDKRKGNNADKKGDKRDGRGGERGSQPREFAPVFHGKSGEKDTEKLDKYERNLFAEEAKNRSSAKVEPERPGKAQISREGSRADMNKHQNGHHSGGGPGKRNQGGNDQDFGQWNGSGRQRQTSNLSKEEMLANGMHGLNMGGRGHHQQDNSYHNQNQGSRGYSDPKVARSNSDRRQGPGFSEDRGQRGRGGHHQSQSLKLTWREGQKCMAKYWEDEQHYQATITGLSPTTAVVLFEAYGNYEEVLLGDLQPLQPPHQQGGRRGGRGGQQGGHHHHGGHQGGGRDIAPTPGLPPAFRH